MLAKKPGSNAVPPAPSAAAAAAPAAGLNPLSGAKAAPTAAAKATGSNPVASATAPLSVAPAAAKATAKQQAVSEPIAESDEELLAELETMTQAAGLKPAGAKPAVSLEGQSPAGAKPAVSLEGQPPAVSLEGQQPQSDDEKQPEPETITPTVQKYMKDREIIYKPNTVQIMTIRDKLEPGQMTVKFQTITGNITAPADCYVTTIQKAGISAKTQGGKTAKSKKSKKRNTHKKK